MSRGRTWCSCTIRAGSSSCGRRLRTGRVRAGRARAGGAHRRVPRGGRRRSRTVAGGGPAGAGRAPPARRSRARPVLADYFDVGTATGGGRLTSAMDRMANRSAKAAHRNDVHLAGLLPDRDLALVWRIVAAVEAAVLAQGVELRRIDRLVHRWRPAAWRRRGPEPRSRGQPRLTSTGRLRRLRDGGRGRFLRLAGQAGPGRARASAELCGPAHRARGAAPMSGGPDSLRGSYPGAAVRTSAAGRPGGAALESFGAAEDGRIRGRGDGRCSGRRRTGQLRGRGPGGRHGGVGFGTGSRSRGPAHGGPESAPQR